MPSAKPRLALTVPDHLRATLESLSEASGKPVATVIVDLLAEMEPQLEGLTRVLRAAKAGNKVAAKRALQHMVGDNLAEILNTQLEFPATKQRRPK